MPCTETTQRTSLVSKGQEIHGYMSERNSCERKVFLWSNEVRRVPQAEQTQALHTKGSRIIHFFDQCLTNIQDVSLYAAG